MDGYITHRIEGISVDIEIVYARPRGFTARFRVFGDEHAGRGAKDEPDWHVVHVAPGAFATEAEAEEAAKSAALAHILAHGAPRA
ncbi:hypothetical protein WKR88_20395 [Trinickia caryophylli]|uniref:Uncharacterized protein n=1 Tax=Trinickia caryophylli TaxID=28094 RepID=A0A1X7G8R4_TRICW|nr:hypothetical protein [Trinickia caryophylli]PMS11413.1 hypothetical protein C0Z17_14840 [Trinickia caryophylli]TRX17608.1 hypothetical protein FNF07_04755 [Trinickia caryophylli]WQE11639.1 hypothetical protein U0034_18145 [Trinickia caryophylli]SMF65988.1 hypothetical protein SAMN06295900_11470 [Trinickia caryophylli]GLU34819.1 hypothetical protein Busp01_46610 [Trinickia caryophylli]